MKRRFDRFFIYFIGYLYMLVMLSLASTVFKEQMPFSTIFLVSVVVYPVISLLLAFRVSRIIAFLALGGAAVASVVLYLTGTGGIVSDQLNNMVAIIERIAYYQQTIVTEQLAAAAILLVVVAAILLTLVVYFLFNRYFNLFLLTGVLIAMHIGIWSLNGNDNKTLLAFTCILTAISYFRHVYERKARQGLITGKTSPGSLMLFTLPAVIIPVLIIMSIPKSDYPITIPWLDRQVFQVFKYLEQRFGHTDVEFFSLAATGFKGSSNRLGGPIRPSHTVMMDVRGDKRTYLRGAAFSRYENNMWIQNPEERENVKEVENALLENRVGWLYIPVDKLFPDVEGNDREILENLASGRSNSFLFPTFSLEIRYRNLTTKTVFTPLLTIMPITSREGGNLDVEQDIHGVTYSENKLPMGSQYTVYYSQPMYAAPVLKRALSFCYDNLYKDALDELKRQRDELMEKSDSQSNTYLQQLESNIEVLESLLRRSEEIEEEYTWISENTPESVKKLARNITHDCKNDYERVIAIQDYLRNNYQYTLSPSRVPDDQDFVEWFLFEDRRGYCTYYATSMTVMLRTLGIPARYVEGFVMPENNQETLYTITSRHAHAWVEVYFQGFGWLIFEPTPIYADVMQYLPSEDNVRRVGENTQNLEDLMKRYAEMYGKFPGDLPDATAGGPVAMDLTPYLKYIPHLIAGLILALVSVNLIAIFVDKLLLMGKNNKRKVIRVFRTMLIWLKHTGYEIRPGETVLEFGQRIDRKFVLKPYAFAEASEIFCRVRYGDKDIFEEDLKVVLTIARQMKKTLLRYFGIRRWVPIRRIVYRI